MSAVPQLVVILIVGGLLSVLFQSISIRPFNFVDRLRFLGNKHGLGWTLILY